MGYLDNAGLAHLWGKVMSALAGKQDALTPDESITLQDGGIGVALPTKSLSRAEYDAMTETEKQAEAVYLVEEPAWTPVPLSIQEYDTEDGWHVRKYSDGYVEMIVSKQYSVGPSRFDVASIAYPISLVKLYGVYPYAYGCGYGTFIADIEEPGKTFLDSTPKCGLYSMHNDRSGMSYFSWLVMGRWK